MKNLPTIETWQAEASRKKISHELTSLQDALQEQLHAELANVTEKVENELCKETSFDVQAKTCAQGMKNCLEMYRLAYPLPYGRLNALRYLLFNREGRLTEGAEHSRPFGVLTPHAQQLIVSAERYCQWLIRRFDAQNGEEYSISFLPYMTPDTTSDDENCSPDDYEFSD